jgi:DNA polymerase (family 10)
VRCKPRELATLELLHATGPHAHVAGLESRASERSTSLEVLARGKDEPEVYRALELPFVPPEVRGSPADFDPNGYSDLLVESDIRGMVHCHTTYSDGRASIEEMALAAEALGMQYITITDHSPSAHYARGVTLDRLKEQWDEIASVQERVRIRILRGTESDILQDGALDYPDEVLERFDVVIASIHARHKLDRERMTERLVRAMSLPIFKIWGHALGRILLSRDPIDCDVPRVLDALASSRGAIELNADPHRLDLPPAWIPEARTRGIPFVVSVDAHSTKGLNVLPLGVRMARRGGLRRHEVLNTLPADELAARVRPVDS